MKFAKALLFNETLGDRAVTAGRIGTVTFL